MKANFCYIKRQKVSVILFYSKKIIIFAHIKSTPRVHPINYITKNNITHEETEPSYPCVCTAIGR